MTRSRRLAAAPPVPSWTAPGAAPRCRSASVDVAATTPRRPGRGALRRRPPSAAATGPRPSGRRWRARLNDIASVIAELSYPAAWRYALRSVNTAMGGRSNARYCNRGVDLSVRHIGQRSHPENV